MKKKMRRIILKIFLGIGIGGMQFAAIFYFALMVSKNKDKTIKKYKLYYAMMCDWMGIMEEGDSLYDHIKAMGYKSIAIYGSRGITEHVIKQLNDTDISVKYLIDRSAYEGGFYGLSLYRPDEDLPKVDAIIVTPVWDYLGIKKQLEEGVTVPIVSLEQLVREKNHE